jgi:hypothetical protein
MEDEYGTARREAVIHGLEWLKKKEAIPSGTLKNTSMDVWGRTLNSAVSDIEIHEFYTRKSAGCSGEFRYSLVCFLGREEWRCEYRGLSATRHTPKQAQDAVIQMIKDEINLP